MKGSDDSIVNQGYYTGFNSSIVTYWPRIITQNPDGNLQETSFNWQVRNLNVTALKATRLAIVPMSTNYTKTKVKGGYAVFYQQEDGRLEVSITDLYSKDLPPDYVISWPTAGTSVYSIFTIHQDCQTPLFTTVPTMTPPSRHPMDTPDG